MKPLIGITSSMEIDETDYMVNKDNINAISRAGGMPVVLPYMTEEDIEQIASTLDGLYLTGGYDIDPTYFGEEPHPNLGTIIPSRDAFEIALIKQMLQKGKPVLAVCRGCQILNIAAGGDMYQDIYSQMDHALLQHRQKAPVNHGSHFVSVLKGSLLYRLTGKEMLKVNSRHHQANRNVGKSIQISGNTSDSIVEAIESKDHPFVLGLQWHPESMIDDESSRKIFQGFIASCNQKGEFTSENN
ncbi:gamma-glutamyl-gamma-aminobutyrate hydrolase family protein [Virgibacillus ndiopensis]|uniref:gamma-glutamyl-gamma-aminobutyrate hydrolase family protein n=1 Tax=Virgibacillus ndiopensis TaxID=2004408 RepID=UPI000C08C352|nr:gamma-glutamyl-gamma-aminobutyrate hydrolase family protein [Virgibacillus ndiopensis]